MKIQLKLFATLASYTPPELNTANPVWEVTDGLRVADLITQLRIPDQVVKLVFVNGRHADPQTVLAAGDRVGLFPPVGGG